MRLNVNATFRTFLYSLCRDFLPSLCHLLSISTYMHIRAYVYVIIMLTHSHISESIYGSVYESLVRTCAVQDNHLNYVSSR